MNVKNCVRCGKMYRPYGGHRICPDCLREEREQYDRVRTYIRKHPKANMVEVSQKTEVPIKKIYEYLREGRITLSSESDIGLTCEKCDEPITTGRFCSRCAGEMEAEMRGAAPSAPSRPSTPSGNKLVREKFLRRIGKK